MSWDNREKYLNWLLKTAKDYLNQQHKVRRLPMPQDVKGIVNSFIKIRKEAVELTTFLRMLRKETKRLKGRS